MRSECLRHARVVFVSLPVICNDRAQADVRRTAMPCGDTPLRLRSFI